MTWQYSEHSGQKKRVQGRDKINLKLAHDIVRTGSFSIICS